MTDTTQELVTQFFADCAQDSREANEKNLHAWLWFSCPASMRIVVEPAIRADARWPQAARRTTQLHLRVSTDEKQRIEERAAAEGVSVGEYIRRRALAE